MDNWAPFSQIDFADESFLEYHIDTRDFHCIANVETKNKIDIRKIKNYPERFFHNPEEVKALINRLYNESGGAITWRMLSLKGEKNWRLKYIRIFRTEYGLVVCDNNRNALSKATLAIPVDQEYLY